MNPSGLIGRFLCFIVLWVEVVVERKARTGGAISRFSRLVFGWLIDHRHTVSLAPPDIVDLDG